MQPTPCSPVQVPAIAMARCKRPALIRSVTAHCPASSGSSNIEHENGRPTPACSPRIYRKAAWSSCSAAALVTHCANLRIGTHTSVVLGRPPGRSCNPTKQASCRAFHHRLRRGGAFHRSQSEGLWAAVVSGKWVQQQRRLVASDALHTVTIAGWSATAGTTSDRFRARWLMGRLTGVGRLGIVDRLSLMAHRRQPAEDRCSTRRRQSRPPALGRVCHERPGYASVRRLVDCIRPGYSTFVILPSAITRHGPLSTDTSAWYV